nr:MAG TPA: hypothetical protein [Caudoviricetes sp.]
MTTFMQLGEILLAFIFWLLNFLRIGLIGILFAMPVSLATMMFLAKHPDSNTFDNHKQD